jgi:GNAT superfamily N-acetyltransferase
MAAAKLTPSGWDLAMYRNFSAAFAAMGSAANVELDGLFAAVSPATPERSVFNSVVYEHPAALAAALDRIARAYDEAGVAAWTVWVPESDRGSERLLESAGHGLDATPTAMKLDLADLPEPQPGDLDWDARGSLEDTCRVNDLAYGYERGTFARGIGSSAEGAYRIYQARLDGEPASVLGTLDLDGDCGVYWVATLPEARGRALSGRLMHVALAEARERGCATSTLQATKLGRPVYERLGYRDIGTLGMWERRR